MAEFKFTENLRRSTIVNHVRMLEKFDKAIGLHQPHVLHNAIR